ncbi:MAG: SpoIID/LytB domain-containing protein [Butyricimonas faecihominis]
MELTVNGSAVLEYDVGEGKTESEEVLDRFAVASDTPRRINAWTYGRLYHSGPPGNNAITITSIERAQGNPIYSGSLEIRQEADGLVLVNDLYLEDYLAKVVPSAMPPSSMKWKL